MAKKPKYLTISDEKAASLRKHRVLGGANIKGTAASASVKSASQSKSSNVGAGKSSGPGGGSLNAPSRTAPSRSAPPSGGGGGGSGMGSQKASANAASKSPMSGQGASYKSPEAAREATSKAVNKSFMDTTRSKNEERMAEQRQKGFGPRVGVDKTAGTISPSSMASQNTLDRIASGSSVVSGYTGKIQDRIAPNAPLTRSATPVKLSQEPTAGPNRGLGSTPARPSDYSTSSMFEGANSPFADEGVKQYDRGTYNQPNAARLAGQYGQYRSAPAPTTEAYTSAMGRYAAAQDPTGIPMPSGRAFPVSQQVSPAPVSEAQRLAAQYGKYRSPPGVPAYDVAQDPRANVNDYRLAMGVPDNTFVGTPAQAAAPPAKTRQDRVVTINGVSYNVSPEQIGQLSPSDQAALNAQLAANQVPTYTPVNTQVPQYGFTNPYAGGVVNNAVNEISPVNTNETPSERMVREAVTDADTYNPNYSPGVAKLVEPISQWAAEKLGTRVAPSQQDSWMGRLDQGLRNVFGEPSPDSAYARTMAMAGQRSSNETGLPRPSAPPPVAATTPKEQPASSALPPLPPYVNYQQLPPNYGSLGYTGGLGASPLVAQYANGQFLDPAMPQQGQMYRYPYRNGGGVGDGIDAAIRLAKLFS